MQPRPDPFDDPVGYLARWLRWPPTGGRSYLHRMLDRARYHVTFRRTMVPVVEAYIALRDRGHPPRPRGRPEGEIAPEAAFARAILRWAGREVPEPLEPLEVMALAVIVGVQPVPARFEKRAGPTSRRDQRALCKERWRVAVRAARAAIAANIRPAK